MVGTPFGLYKFLFKFKSLTIFPQSHQASESKKRLALAIIDFLEKSTTDGTLPADESESVSVAIQIIADAFKVDPSNQSAKADALGGRDLQSIYGVFEKMRERTAAAGKPAAPQPAPPTPPTSAPTPPPSYATAKSTPEQKAEADNLKGQGNAAMARKDYPSAIDLYTKALELTPGNPIFLSNRAAAYSASHQHQKAAVDAQAAVDTDPTYSKAWSRLGLAKFALGDTRGAMAAYKKGMDVESESGTAPSEAMRRGFETAKRRLAEEEEEGEEGYSSPAKTGSGAGGAGGLPDLSSLASMFGGGGGGASGGGGGMPDLSGILSNPMFSQMAQNLMKNPEMMNNLLNNPRLKEMMDGVGGGSGGSGGLPDMSKLMSDPTIAEM